MHFRPSKYLPSIHKRERVYLVLRRHWLIPTTKACLWVFLLVVILLGSTFAKSNFEILSTGLGENILDIIISSFIIMVSLGLLIVWTMYYLNVQIVTNERIIDINQKSIIHHETTGLNLKKVQDVTTEIKGPLANIFNYGNVFVQTAGTEQNFIFDHIESPHQTAKTVLALSKNATAHFKKSLARDKNSK